MTVGSSNRPHRPHQPGKDHDFIPTNSAIMSLSKSIDFERQSHHCPEIWLVMAVSFDQRGYFLGGFNLFKLANKKLFDFFHIFNIDHLLVYGKYLYVPSAAAL